MCVDGARWVQDELLDKHPDADLRVYAIWMPMLFTDRISRWGAKELTDSRVQHFWDSERVLGKWFAMGSDATAGEILWDAYLLYGREASWGTAPGLLISSGVPIIAEVEALRRDVLAVSR